MQNPVVIGKATLYLGDCRDFMPRLDFSVAITDPPYDSKYYKTDTNAFSGEVLDLLVKRTRSCAVFGWPEKLIGLCVETGLVPDEWITWWPTNAAMRGFSTSGLWREAECIAAFGPNTFQALRRPKSEFGEWFANKWVDDEKRPSRLERAKGGESRLGDVWRHHSPHLGFTSDQRLHPNEKPLDVMDLLVSGLSTEGDVVCDPFMGSGTTGAACLHLNRRFIGIELEPEFFDIACKRIDAAQRQERLFA